MVSSNPGSKPTPEENRINLFCMYILHSDYDSNLVFGLKDMLPIEEKIKFFLYFFRDTLLSQCSM